MEVRIPALIIYQDISVKICGSIVSAENRHRFIIHLANDIICSTTKQLYDLAAKRDEIWHKCMYLQEKDPRSRFHKMGELKELKTKGEELNRIIKEVGEQLTLLAQCVKDKIIC